MTEAHERTPDSALPVGTEVRVHNPASAFHGRRAVVMGYVWPSKAHSPVLLRLLPDPEGPPLPFRHDDIEGV